MALDEVTFYNIVGEEVNLTNLVSQMIDYYGQKLAVGETRLTDFNEGSEIRDILEASAVLGFAILEDINSSGKLPFIRLSEGVYLDYIGENPFIRLSRNTGDYAEGIVVFTLNEVQDTDFIIPAETIVTDTVEDLDFETTVNATIPAGETSVEVPVTCLTMGTNGNVPAGTITILEDDDLNFELLTVNNPEALTGGAEYEDDEVYRARLLELVRAEGFGTSDYYINLGEAVRGVHDVKFVNDNKFTRKVIVNGLEKPVPNKVLLDVLAEYTISANHILDHSFTVEPVDYTTINLNFNLGVNVEGNQEDYLNNLTAFINGTNFDRAEYSGLNIDETLTKFMLESAFDVFDNIVTVDVVINNDETLTEVTPSLNTVFKLGNVTINETVV